MSPRQGRSLERLVAFLEGALASNQKVKVESPFRMRDCRTGRLREHDVVLISDLGHHVMQVAIECRDRRRPVGVPHVEAFYQKCVDTNVGLAVIVSSTGFYQSAREKAQSLGIRCLELNQIPQVDWLALSGLVVLRSHMEHAELTYYTKEGGLDGQRPFEVVDAEGKVVPDLRILTSIHNAIIEKVLTMCSPGRNSIPIKLAINGLFARVSDQGELFTIIGIGGTVYYATEAKTEPYRLLRYEEQAGDRKLAEVAVADVTHGDLSGQVALIVDAERKAMMSFIPKESMKAAEPSAQPDANRKKRGRRWLA